MHRTLLAALLAISLSAVSTPVRAVAQDTPVDTHDDDDGFDKGLLGLLGLAGLLGLRRRDHADQHRSTTGRV